MKKLSFKFKVTLFFVIITLSCYSQKSKPPIFISKVYNDMFAAMDNGQTIKPRIFLFDDNLEVVSFYPLDNEIRIGKKFVTLLRNFKKDSCNALAHVLGHELAHVLLQQNDYYLKIENTYYSLTISNRLQKFIKITDDSIIDQLSNLN